MTESSVTKTFVAERHHNDDGTWTIEERSFEKRYAWGAGGELFVIEWRGDREDANEAASPGIERYGCRSGTEESGGMTVDGLGLIGERDFGSIGCRQ